LILFILFIIQVELIIDKTDDFIVYQGLDQHLVEEQMVSDEATLTLNKVISYFWKQKYFKLDPFQSSCFSIRTESNFKININSFGTLLSVLIY